MPEVSFTIRWPDGSEQACFSPSRTIERAVVAGAQYPVAELVRRCTSGLHEGSERLRSLKGFGCSAALQTATELQERATAFDAAALATVVSVQRARREPRRPAPGPLEGHYDAVIVGGGQAGLAASYELSRRGVEHVVLERDRMGCSWRDQRWDSFCLVTPNWQCTMPGLAYDGDDPDGFMVKDEILAYLDRCAEVCDPPLHEGVTVLEVARAGDMLRVATDAGVVTCDHVVLCVGGYHRPRLGRLSERMPSWLTQLHSSGYKNPTSLPDGGVLVVGTGQSGAQIAEDLHVAGREVHVAVGSAPRVARFYRGRDCVAWLEDIGHYRMSITEHPQGLAARKEPNHYVTGRGGGHDIDLRAFARDGMQLHGRLVSADGGGVLGFGDRLAADLDAADATADRIKDTIDRHIAEAGVEAPVEERYVPVWHPVEDGSAPLDLAASGVRSIVWATGFDTDWTWVKLPVFDGTGYPAHLRGITSDPAVCVLGLPWLHTWGSGRFAGIAQDAAHVAEHIGLRVAGAQRPAAAA